MVGVEPGLATPDDLRFMGMALRLARRGLGLTSPNPVVGAVLVRGGQIIGQGWHRKAGEPHAELEALKDAAEHGRKVAGATLYVTLEPCSTHGRTPPCTDAIVRHRLSRVVVAATDPNPAHAGRGFDLLTQAGVKVVPGVRMQEATRLNEAFNHWIVHGSPFVTVKAALSADGKIATASGESKWITGVRSRAWGMQLRRRVDAILVGINTVLQDDPRLTVRRGEMAEEKRLRRIILDALARTPLQSQVVVGPRPELTTIVTSMRAPAKRLAQLRERVSVLTAPSAGGRIDLGWLLATLGKESVTHLLVEGGGEVNASFLMGGYAQRVALFYAPKILGGRTAPGPVGGLGIPTLAEALPLRDVEWKRVGEDFLLTARLDRPQPQPS